MTDISTFAPQLLESFVIILLGKNLWYKELKNSSMSGLDGGIYSTDSSCIAESLIYAGYMLLFVIHTPSTSIIRNLMCICSG